MKTNALAHSVDVTALTAVVTHESKGSETARTEAPPGAFRQAMAALGSGVRAGAPTSAAPALAPAGPRTAPTAPAPVAGGFYGDLLPNQPPSSFELPLGSRVVPPSAPPFFRAVPQPSVPTEVVHESREVAFVPPRDSAPPPEVLLEKAPVPPLVEEPPPSAAPDPVPALPPALSQPVFEGLRLGDRGEAGPRVERLQGVLRKWNPRLDVGPAGCYTQRTAEALTLFKVIYGSGADGQRVDGRTAENLARMEDGSFWKSPPRKSPGGEILYHASRDLGVPYSMGGDGQRATDCGMLTRRAVVHAGLADSTFSRLADVQYYYAERGLKGMKLRSSEPRAGDLVFFTNPTRQSHQAYQGVTHVGLYVGEGRILAASSGRGRVVMQSLGGLGPYVKGFASFPGGEPVAQVP